MPNYDNNLYSNTLGLCRPSRFPLRFESRIVTCAYRYLPKAFKELCLPLKIKKKKLAGSVVEPEPDFLAGAG